MAGKEKSLGPTGETVRDNIREFRERADLTFAEMSRRLKAAGRPIPPLGLRRIESGERRVDVDDLTAIAVVLDVAPVRLMLPGISSTAITAELTGTTPRSTTSLWLWALGYRALSGEVVASRDFRARSQPRTIRTKKERIAARRAWLSEKIDGIDEELSQLTLLGGEDAYMAQSAAARLREEVEQLEDVDPEDDELFAEIFGDEDPAPPSPEELDGLLNGGAKNG